MCIKGQSEWQRLSLDINISTKYDIRQNIDTQQE